MQNSHILLGLFCTLRVFFPAIYNKVCFLFHFSFYLFNTNVVWLRVWQVPITGTVIWVCVIVYFLVGVIKNLFIKDTSDSQCDESVKFFMSYWFSPLKIPKVALSPRPSPFHWMSPRTSSRPNVFSSTQVTKSSELSDPLHISLKLENLYYEFTINVILSFF